MVPSFIITFREALEAALIIGIILSFLARTNKTKYNYQCIIGDSRCDYFRICNICGINENKLKKIL